MCMILAAALDLYCLVLYFIRTTCLLAICALHADDVYLSKLPVAWQARNEYMLTVDCTAIDCADIRREVDIG